MLQIQIWSTRLETLRAPPPQAPRSSQVVQNQRILVQTRPPRPGGVVNKTQPKARPTRDTFAMKSTFYFFCLKGKLHWKKEPGKARVEWPPCLHAGTMQSRGRPCSSEEHLRPNRPETVRFRVCRAQTVEEPKSHSTARIVHPRSSPIPGLSHAWTSGFISRPGGKVAKKLQKQDSQCCVICETRWRHLSRRLQIKRDKETEQRNRPWWTLHSTWVQRTSSDPAQRWE